MRIERISHVNVNCRTLARSRNFYEELLGLQPAVHTAPAPQDGDAFGLGKHVAWDAWILHDTRGFPEIAVDLLEWKQPTPCGAAATLPHQQGFSRLRFATDDLEGLHARCGRARAAGLTPIATAVIDGLTTAARFRVQDPDGTLLEFVAGDRLQLTHVLVNTTDLPRARAFYGEVLGLPGAGPADPVFHQEHMGMAPATYASVLYADPRGPAHCAIQLLRWSKPRPPAPMPRFANSLGIYRLAFIVDDITAAYAHLTAHGARCLSRPADLDVGEGLPRLKVFLCPDPDGTMLEFVENPIG